MNAAEAIEILSKLPGDTILYNKYASDDAYPLDIKIFKEGNDITPYFVVDMVRLDEHRNYPEKYRGVVEIKKEDL